MVSKILESESEYSRFEEKDSNPNRIRIYSIISAVYLFRENILKLKIFTVYRGIFALVASMSILATSSILFAGDVQRSLCGAARMVALVTERDSSAGITLNENIGNIYMRDVEFAYSSR